VRLIIVEIKCKHSQHKNEARRCKQVICSGMQCGTYSRAVQVTGETSYSLWRQQVPRRCLNQSAMPQRIILEEVAILIMQMLKMWPLSPSSMF